MRADDPFRQTVRIGDLVRVQDCYAFMFGPNVEHTGIFLGDAPDTSVAPFYRFVLLTQTGPIPLLWQDIVWGGLIARFSEAVG